jgi:hypothetical protein
MAYTPARIYPFTVYTTDGEVFGEYGTNDDLKAGSRAEDPIATAEFLLKQCIPTFKEVISAQWVEYNHGHGVGIEGLALVFSFTRPAKFNPEFGFQLAAATAFYDGPVE